MLYKAKKKKLLKDIKEGNEFDEEEVIKEGINELDEEEKVKDEKDEEEYPFPSY